MLKLVDPVGASVTNFFEYLRSLGLFVRATPAPAGPFRAGTPD